MKLDLAEPASVKSGKGKPSETPKSVKNKASKNKKKKSKKGKKKKTVANSLATDQSNVVDALTRSPVVANLFLKLMGQDLDLPKDDVKIEQSPMQLQVPIAEEVSEEEYYSESASSEENEAPSSLTPSHTI